MIDPDGIQIQRGNLPISITIEQVPEFESQIYNLEEDSDFKKYIADIKREVRRSFEYRRLIKFLRENFGMDHCAVLQNISNTETFDIKIEIHHYPFTLEDVVKIVVNKRTYYHEALDVQMVAKEVMQLHYRCVIGLISLSETVHQLAHASRLFIPVDRVFGRYGLFVDYYRPFIDDDLLDVLDRIEKNTTEHTEVNDTTILDLNQVSFDVKNKQYQLPDTSSITSDMKNQLEMIKSNNYLLPSVSEVNDIIANQNQENSPIVFHKDKVIIDIPPNQIEKLLNSCKKNPA